MTPNPMNNGQSPVAPAALPLVALILGVLGFCLPPLFLIAIILAIVSLAKSGEPAFAARKTLAIITLSLAVIYVPIVGILAAIAIPNFIKFQSRSKQAECKVNLKMAYTGQKSLFAESDKYSATAADIGFVPDGKNRYTYLLSEDEIIPATLSQTSGNALLAGVPSTLRAELGVQGTCPDCSVTMACAGNIDNDDTIDVWSISTRDRTVNGQPVSAGVPFNDVSDVTD